MKEQVIAQAMESFGWKRAKVLSWYKLENRWLGGNSPRELVDRGEGERVLEFLRDRVKFRD